MVSLTTQHRDLLRHIINADGSVAAADIARRMELTPRQVRYRLKTAEVWLAERDATIKSVPGAGILLECSSGRRSDLLRQLDAEFEFDLILSPGQRVPFPLAAMAWRVTLPRATVSNRAA